MKIAYRTVGGLVLATGYAITKEEGRLLVVAPDGGSREIEYGAFADLTAADVSVATYGGALPTGFKADASHTWNGSAFVATDWEPEVIEPPIPEQSWTELEFRRRFTQAERIAIAVAKTQSADLADFEELLQCAGRSGAHILNTDPDLQSGLQALVDATILTAERKRAILGG